MRISCACPPACEQARSSMRKSGCRTRSVVDLDGARACRLRVAPPTISSPTAYWKRPVSFHFCGSRGIGAVTDPGGACEALLLRRVSRRRTPILARGGAHGSIRSLHARGSPLARCTSSGRTCRKSSTAAHDRESSRVRIGCSASSLCATAACIVYVDARDCDAPPPCIPLPQLHMSTSAADL